MLFNNVLKVVVAALLLHYDCFATFYEHALQHFMNMLCSMSLKNLHSLGELCLILC